MTLLRDEWQKWWIRGNMGNKWKFWLTQAVKHRFMKEINLSPISMNFGEHGQQDWSFNPKVNSENFRSTGKWMKSILAKAGMGKEKILEYTFIARTSLSPTLLNILKAWQTSLRYLTQSFKILVSRKILTAHLCTN